MHLPTTCTNPTSVINLTFTTIIMITKMNLICAPALERRHAPKSPLPRQKRLRRHAHQIQTYTKLINIIEIMFWPADSPNFMSFPGASVNSPDFQVSRWPRSLGKLEVCHSLPHSEGPLQSLPADQVEVYKCQTKMTIVILVKVIWSVQSLPDLAVTEIIGWTLLSSISLNGFICGQQ